MTMARAEVALHAQTHTTEEVVGGSAEGRRADTDRFGAAARTKTGLHI